MSHSESRDPLPTIWEVSDAMWENLFVPLLRELDAPSRMGRPRADQRKCLDGIIYRARTGCQWNQLPAKFGSDSTVHRTLRRWDDKGVLDAIWALLIYHVEELRSVHWEWQAADGMLNKARFIGAGAKGGIKRASQGPGMPKRRRAMAASTGAAAGADRKAASDRTGYPLGATAPTPRGYPASKPVCLSRAKAAHWLSASPRLT
jgi:transposase